MRALNFPKYDFRFRNADKPEIFDQIRRKFVVLTPEEWVRQHTVNYLIREKKYPLSLINVEKLLLVNGTRKRYDIVVYNPNGSIRILVECKAPEVAVTQQVFDQIARYNLTLDAATLMVTNGINHYVCRIDYANARYDFLTDLPDADA